jgi:hypothetical protein
MENKVPIITANSKPFRLVSRDDQDIWNPSLEHINTNTYDYVKLHRLSTFFDVGITPFSLGICFDGTLILPGIEIYRDREVALAKFNQTLVELLLGGLYCEAADPDDIGYGSLTFDGYTRIFGGMNGPAASFHYAARMKMSSIIDAIRLFKPEIVSVQEMKNALSTGRKLLTDLGSIPKEQILYGATFYVRKQWAESLLHFWTTTEMIVETAWQRYVLWYPSPPSKKRRAFLEDHRTWTVSAKLEVLYQKNLLSADVYEVLSMARKARNNFTHHGDLPTRSDAYTALRGCFEMASLCASEFTRSDLFSNVVNLLESRCNPELFPEKAQNNRSEVTHWLPIPPIPGDIEWGDKPYEIIEELGLKPLDFKDSN